MNRWTDTAIILSLRKLGESAAVVKLFSREQGLCSGVVRHVNSKVNRGIYQPGNLVQAHWQARVEGQLGTLHSELSDPFAAFLLTKPVPLLAMSAALMMIEMALPEHDAHPQLYDHVHYFLQRLKYELPWQGEYVRLELCLLAECGFGLELDSCAATGLRENLVYVSPKSGQAVCTEAGKPYHHKLLKLPSYLKDTTDPEGAEDLTEGLQLTGYFLEHRLFTTLEKSLPIIRQRLINTMLAPTRKMEPML